MRIKKEKGFTLIELLAVLVVLSLTIVVGFNVIMRTISSSKESAYQEQINRVIKLSKTWASDNSDELPKENEKYFISLNDLRQDELLKGEVINPNDNKEMDGCVKVTYDSNTKTHLYNYEEGNLCPKENENYTITYDLDGGTLDFENPTSYTARTETFSLNNPTKLGYSFRGWIIKDDDEPDTSKTIYKGSIGNIHFKAVYEIDVHVTIDPNGGTYGGSSESYSFYVEPYSSLELITPQRENHEFLGWETNIEDITLDGNNVTFGITSVVIKARWTNCITVDGQSFYNYTNSVTYVDDKNGKYRLKFLKTGTLTLNCPTSVDIFLVGGGSAKGGSGYTKTYRNINLEGGKAYEVTVGIGGTTSTINGTASSFKINDSLSYTAAAGNGANGGSGAGGSGYTSGGSKGGEDGKSGKGGTGQGSTTREFGESTGALYAGGGGGGGGAVYGEDAETFDGGAGGAGGGGRGSGDGYNCTNGGTNTGGGGGLGIRGAVKCNGGSGIVIIRNIVCIGNDKYCYTGRSQYIDDGNGNFRIKLLSSGKLKIYDSTIIDAFLVGGGSSMGGGGYTLTKKGISLTGGVEYDVIVGDGGIPGKNGYDTIFYESSSVYHTAKAANGSSGGSGGGASGYTSGGANGGSDGGNGGHASNGGAGTGQGSTTREFGESTGALYAGGGGGGGGAIYGEDAETFNGGSGGSGGGGRGAGDGYGCTNGGANTGGGAGTGIRGSANCYGGSGIVVIRNAR